MKDLQSFGDVLEFAIEREIEANDFYERLAGQVKSSKTRRMLKEFALDEYQHRIRLEAIRAGEMKLAPDEVGSFDIKAEEEVKLTTGLKYVDALLLAMKKEKKAFKLYSRLAELAPTKDLREIFLLLAQEEARHKLRFEIEYDLATF